MSPPDHILIVDDDKEIRSLLGTYLSRNGYRANGVADGKELWQFLARQKTDLIVLDLMLPGTEDGLDLCRRLRAEGDTPILMLTARGDDVDRILGLEMGADDYLPKPCNPRELLARIRSILRRTRSLPDNLQPEAISTFRFAGWRLDTITRQLVSPENVVVSLSGAEYRMLRLLLEHANHVLSRDQLMNLMHGRDAGPFDRGVDILVSRVRQRLNEDAREPVLIKTVRNEGYVLAVAVTTE